MLSTYLERPVTGVLAKMGVSPNMVTFAGLLGAGVSAWLISEGMLWAGGVVMLLAGVLDLFDGSLARSTGKESPFGALLDSVVDRVSEIVVLLGLLIHYARSDSLEGTVLVYLAVGGSVMVSYLRARSEGLGIDCKVGIMTRPEARSGAGRRHDNRALVSYRDASGARHNRRADHADNGAAPNPHGPLAECWELDSDSAYRSLNAESGVSRSIGVRTDAVTNPPPSQIYRQRVFRANANGRISPEILVSVAP